MADEVFDAVRAIMDAPRPSLDYAQSGVTETDGIDVDDAVNTKDRSRENEPGAWQEWEAKHASTLQISFLAGVPLEHTANFNSARHDAAHPVEAAVKGKEAVAASAVEASPVPPDSVRRGAHTPLPAPKEPAVLLLPEQDLAPSELEKAFAAGKLVFAQMATDDGELCVEADETIFPCSLQLALNHSEKAVLEADLAAANERALKLHVDAVHKAVCLLHFDFFLCLSARAPRLAFTALLLPLLVRRGLSAQGLIHEKADDRRAAGRR
jgi:hypothetical protein